MKRALVFAAAALVLIVSSGPASDPSYLEEYIEVFVRWAITADTIIAEVKDVSSASAPVEVGDVVWVRYSGIECPESDEYFSAPATEANKELVENKTVYLVIDPRRAIDGDIVLAYAFLDLSGDKMVNKILLSEGAAAATPHFPSVSYAKEFGALAETARHEKVGMWKCLGKGPFALLYVKAVEECICLVNTSNTTANLRGWTISDWEGSYTFDRDIFVAPTEVYPVYDETYNPDGDDRLLRLRDAFDQVFLHNRSGILVDYYDWCNESWCPEGGEVWKPDAEAEELHKPTATCVRIAYINIDEVFSVFTEAVADLREKELDKQKELLGLQQQLDAGTISHEEYNVRSVELEVELLQAELDTDIGTIDAMMAASELADIYNELQPLRELAQVLIHATKNLVSTVHIGVVDVLRTHSRYLDVKNASTQLDQLLTQAATARIVQVAEKVAVENSYDLVLQTRNVIVYANPARFFDITEEVKRQLLSLF